MSYRLKLSDRFAESVRRVGREQIDAALPRLRAPGEPAAIIHATRKSLKKIRALLRLARPNMPQDAYAAENARYRDIGRRLSGVRDKHVMLETLDDLHERAEGRTQAALAVARTRIAGSAGRRKGQPSDAASADVAALFGEVERDLEAGRQAMADLPVAGGRRPAAFEGVEDIYRRARRAMIHAFTTLHSEDLHEFRKQVQHHWRHMQLVAAAWPEFFEARVATARRLSQLLGSDHDLAVLIAELDGPEAPRLTDNQRASITEFALSRQAALRQDAYVLGQRLFADPAGTFREQVVRYWQTASSEPPAEVAAE